MYSIHMSRTNILTPYSKLMIISTENRECLTNRKRNGN